MSEWTPPSARERLGIMQRTRSVALYGASANPARPSYFVATYLVSSTTDFDVYFVNPSADEILGLAEGQALDVGDGLRASIEQGRLHFVPTPPRVRG